jgi:hypothetical protein
MDSGLRWDYMVVIVAAAIATGGDMRRKSNVAIEASKH